MYKVNCIVPIYNVEKYVDKCIASLLNQSYQQLEIILVDDGSTDHSGDICDRYAQKDNRVRVVHKENGGLSSARNAGLDVAEGEYILFIDGDDYLVPDSVDCLMNLQKKFEYKLDLIQFFYDEVEEDEESLFCSEREDRIEMCTDRRIMFEKLYELGGVAASACTKMYHKKLFEDLRFKEGIIHEDEYMVTDILRKVKNCLYTNRSLYRYVMRPGSIVKSDFTPKKLEVFVAIQYRRQYLKKAGYKELLEKENLRYFMSLMTLYCDAYASQSYDSCKEIENKLKELLNATKINAKGKMEIFENLCRINTRFAYVYYLLRKMTGKI